MSRLNVVQTPTGPIMRGDAVLLAGFPFKGTVLRVARDASWVDVWWRSDGSFGWAKRMTNPDELMWVRTND